MVVKPKRIEDFGLDPVLLERDKQRGLEMLRKYYEQQEAKTEKNEKLTRAKK